MEIYADNNFQITPQSVGSGKVCTVVKTAIDCSGSGTQTNCPSFGNCTNGSC